MELGTHLGIYW